MIDSVVAALRDLPRGSELLVAGDFNADLDQPEEAWIEEDILAYLTASG